MSKSLATVYHNLSVMLQAGVPLLRSLETAGSAAPARLRRTLQQIKQQISQGSSLAEAAREHTKLFGPIDLAVIEAAEISGQLAELLGLLARQHEFSHRLRRQLRAGLILPAMVLHIGALAAPIPTLVLGKSGLQRYLFSVAAILAIFYVPTVAVILIMHFCRREGPAKYLLDRLVLHVPVLSQAIRDIALSRFCRIFHTLTKAGVPAADCVSLAAAGCGNTVMARLVRGGAESARQGQPVLEGFSPKLPELLLCRWQIGEESGQLEKITAQLAQTYAEQGEFYLGEFVRWLPRVIYFAICGLMIYFIFRNYQAIYSSIPPM